MVKGQHFKRALIFFILFCVTTFCVFSGLFRSLDLAVYERARFFSTSFGWLRVWESVTLLGSGAVVAVVLTSAFIVLVTLTHHNRIKLIFCLLFVLFIFVVHLGLKEIFDIGRPHVLADFYPQPITQSFPSGHSVDAVVLFYFIPRFLGKFVSKRHLKPFFSPRSWKLFSSLVGIFLVAFSRIFLGVHWFSDVVGGILWGFFVSEVGLGILERSLVDSRPSSVDRRPLLNTEYERRTTKYKAIIHDLDGTLIDSKRDIVASVNAMIVKYGGEVLADEEIHRLVGTGADDLVRRAMPNLGTEKQAVAYDFLLRHYLDHCLDFTRTSPHVTEALEIFSRAGVKQAVLTNKPQPITDAIIKGLKLEKCFTVTLGTENGFPHKPNPEGTRYVLQKLGVDPAQALMVGDSLIDLETARNVGMDCVLVLNGYSRREDLLAVKDRVVALCEDYRGVVEYVRAC